MYNDSVKTKIEELMISTPSEIISVGYSTKIKNGEDTGEYCIRFGVIEKKPLSELKSNEILPSEIEIDGEIYKTDVIKTELVLPLVCESTTQTNCYNWCQINTCCVYDDLTNQYLCVGAPGGNTNNLINNIFISPQNRLRHRPIKGGISMTTQNNLGSVGTLGLLALDNDTNALVGVTNLHVAIGKGFYTAYMNPNWTLHNETSDNVYQSGESPNAINSNPSFYKIGEVLRYKPLHWYPYRDYRDPGRGIYSIYTQNHTPSWSSNLSITNNQIDAAVFSINNDAVNLSNLSLSSEQFGIGGTQFMPFATTQEINSLLNQVVKSSGRTSGVKSGTTSTDCGIKITALGLTVLVPYEHQLSTSQYSNGIDTQPTNSVWHAYAYFTNCIEIKRINTDCGAPIAPGDSGSALIAEIGGVHKIVGLVFAGSSYVGIVCRIDEIASQLNIKAWTGQTPTFVTTKSYITVPGRSLNDTEICGSQTHRQVGLYNNRINCPGSRNTPFVSKWTTTTSGQTITLPLYNGGNYLFNVDWGDGTLETIFSDETKTHTYSTSGTYTVTIDGIIEGWNFNEDSTSKDDIIEIVSWGELKLGDLGSHFKGCSKLTLTNTIDVLDLSNITNFSETFKDCKNLTTINNSVLWDTSKIENMNYMFENCLNFNGFINKWDVSSVITMEGLFKNCVSYDNILYSWKPCNVVNMDYMFQNCQMYNQYINSWKVPNILFKPILFDEDTDTSWTTTKKPQWGVIC